MSTRLEPLRDSSAVLADGDELARRMAADGYLFFPRLLPRRQLAAVRRRLLGYARDAGWLSPGAPLEEGVAEPSAFCVDPQPQYKATHHRMYTLEALHRLPHRRELLELFGRLVRPPVLVHPRPALRVVFPGGFTTSAHQDFPFVQGTTDTFTAWIPLMDCPRSQGVLELAPGSHTAGVLPVQPSLGPGGAEVVDGLSDWASGDLRLGDVLVFHSLTVHRTTANVSRRLRISLDCRYQSIHEPVNSSSLTLSGLGMSWEDLYRDWRSSRHRYYWRAMGPRVEPFDPSYLEQRDRMAIEMGERGDPRSLSALQRLAAHDEDPEKRALARRLLDRLPDAAGVDHLR
ncbi:MAG: phytanoyl-CoA dioxygenase family protein [Solirubrobacterales bacterium]|nr:phytanoyl-CoA dioxygenase family protein [Solirubrobacterales bacterium]